MINGNAFSILDIMEWLEISLQFERFSLSREGFLRRGVMMECLSRRQNSTVARLRSTMRVMIGARR